MLPLSRTAVLNTHREIANFHGYAFCKSNPVLGRGGQGWVYRGFLASRWKVGQFVECSRKGEVYLGLPVALKFYEEDLPRNEDPAWFERAKAAVQLSSHPGIVTSYDFCCTETAEFRYAFLVMELVEGQNLRDWMRSRWEGSDPASKDVQAVLFLLCEAIRHLHGQHVLHRDLKPANVFIRNDDSACVMDLGMARLHEMPGVDAPIGRGTPSDAFLGSVPYSSPQALRGEGYEKTDDLYSIGAILFDMLFYPEAIFEKYRPYSREMSVHRLRQAVEKDEPLKEVSKNPPDWAGHGLLSLAGRLLSKARSERPRDIETLIAEIQAAL